MSSQLHSDKDVSVSAEELALDWFVKLQSGNFNEQEQAELSKWVASSDTHRAAFEAVAGVWRNAGETDQLVMSDVAQHATDTVTSISGWRQKLSASRLLSLGKNPLTGAVAACLLITMSWIFSDYQLTPEPTSYSSNYSGNKEVQLEDGSVILLSGNSTVSVSMNEDLREVQLLSGAAFFDIASEPQRPFYVTASDVRVRVTGTAFEVRMAAKDVRVSLQEGSLKVSALQHMDHALVPGQQISYRDGQYFTGISDYDPAIAMQWLQGRLNYANAPLAEVVQDVNRYREKPFVLASPDIASLQVTAAFTITDSSQLLSGLKYTHGIVPQEMADRVILSTRSSTSPH